MSKIELLFGNCLEILPNIPSESIDAIITDLPYGQTTRNKWDHIIPMEDYIEINGKYLTLSKFLLYKSNKNKTIQTILLEFSNNKKHGLWSHFNRIIKEHGIIILFGNGLFSSSLMESNKKMWRYNLIWEKTQPTGHLNAKRMPMRNHEDICIFYKKQPTYNPQKTSGHKRKVSKAEHKINCKQTSNYGEFGLTTYDSTERYPKSVWQFPKDIQKSALHPTQKPVALLEEIIKTYTNEGDILLDPCMGSGSTLVAAQNLNRNGIGIENEKDIFSIAKKRILAE